jgi:hypothetical protein
MFQPVDSDNLYYNQKYKIVADDEYSGIYKGKFWSNDLYLEFDDVCNLSRNYYSPRYFMPTRKFYKFVSQKARIQSDMEHRAVNKIVGGLIGDAYFKW